MNDDVQPLLVPDLEVSLLFLKLFFLFDFLGVDIYLSLFCLSLFAVKGDKL
jgi:hypothetical protein